MPIHPIHQHREALAGCEELENKYRNLTNSLGRYTSLTKLQITRQLKCPFIAKRSITLPTECINLYLLV